MITGIEIENYKCFGKRVHIPLAPITVLVGPNSAGKTTIIRLLAALQQTHDSKQPFCALLPKGQLTDLGSVDNVFHRGRRAEGTTIGFRFSRDEDRHLPAFTFRIRMEATEGQQFELLAPRRFQFLAAPDGEVILDLECPDPPEKVGSKSFDHEGESFDLPLYRVIVRECSSSPALWKEAFQRLCDRAHQEQQKEDAEEERRQSAPPPKGPEIYYLLASYRLDPDFRHFLLHEATLESFADRMASKALGDQQSLSGGSFLPPTLEGFFEEAFMPNRFCSSAEGQLIRLFQQLDFYSPVRSLPARDVRARSPVPDGKWEDGSSEMNCLAREPELRAEVSRWLDQMTGATLSDPSPGSPIKLFDSIAGCDTPLDLADVGYGITHLLPILTRLLGSERMIAVVQQPETHVHPSLQAEIGELFVHAWNIHETRSIVETHSEYIIRRLQRCVRKGKQAGGLAPTDVAVLYVDRHPEGSTVTHLRMDAAGDFIVPWPHGFFAEGLKEVLGD